MCLKALQNPNQEVVKMRKRLVVLMALLFTLASVAPLFAQSDIGQEVTNQNLAKAKSLAFSGTVVSHDTKCHCFVIKGAKGELTLQDDYAKFMDEYDQAKGLKIGSRVTGHYKVLNHINYATDLRYADKS